MDVLVGATTKVEDDVLESDEGDPDTVPPRSSSCGSSPRFSVSSFLSRGNKEGDKGVTNGADDVADLTFSTVGTTTTSGSTSDVADLTISTVGTTTTSGSTSDVADLTFATVGTTITSGSTSDVADLTFSTVGTTTTPGNTSDVATAWLEPFRPFPLLGVVFVWVDQVVVVSPLGEAEEADDDDDDDDDGDT
ncbi:hypothetical protein HMI55_001062 [Coelomomyces lativittatus]|nr:hypothetical protein HMI55_001062 [Coelomomyces lativittatus]